jgi:MYXO-CTERM domain-containing protein
MAPIFVHQGGDRRDRADQLTDSEQPTMKTNVKTSCAIGAMLFGGTLGAAHAGVVGLPGRPTGGPNSRAEIEIFGYNPSTYTQGYTWNVAGNPTNDRVQFDGTSTSYEIGGCQVDQFTGADFPFGFYRRFGAGYTTTADVDQYFTVYGNYTFSLTAQLGLEDVVAISHYDANHQLLADSIRVTTPGPVNLSAALVDCLYNGDYYKFHFSMSERAGIGDQTLETLFSLSFAPSVTVPAPGAFALLGMAGFAGRRRRR